MVSWLLATPGRVYLVATFLPLIAFVFLLIGGGIRAVCRPYRDQNPFARFGYFFLGGHKPLKVGAAFATLTIAIAAGLAVFNLVKFLGETDSVSPIELEHRWAETATWARVGSATADTETRGAVALELGYRIDRLTALLFAMVSVVSTCIFVFSLGYMKDETEEHHRDHEAHVTRPGRYGRFFLFLSLFSFSMLNLLIADNLFQVFVSWELVGVCSFFLIGFYHERPSAGRAATKAFVMNRIGDAGFLVGLAIVWSYFGTFNFERIFSVLASGPLPHQMPYYAFVIAGIGIFLGCVGKSAQFPLHTWLPDAMEGPTPVSALIHAATMVAAGVYLVGRCYPLFAPEVLLLIAYTGAITLFLGASIAVVMTDIKRVLAYSTVSQLGFMMLALGVGGWVAGLLHLITHAFFKSLLFLGAGSVIDGCYHEQDLTKMGGLRKRMPVTAYTMLIGVLAIAGTPFFSGWYSKDMIVTTALGYAVHDPRHALLFVLPLIAAGLTAFYMFRLWFLAFGGTSRSDAASLAHESSWVMTGPLVILAAFSFGVAWGWPAWDPEAGYLAHLLEEGASPAAHGMAWVDHRGGWLALAAAMIGAGLAVLIYGVRAIKPASLSPLHRFLRAKWYFDHLYDAAFVRPAVATAYGTARFDKRAVPAEQAELADRTIDVSSLDGVLNALGLGTLVLGKRARGAQSGLIRNYVTVLMAAVVALVAAVVAGFLVESR